MKKKILIGVAVFIVLILITPFLIPKSVYLNKFIVAVEKRYPVDITLTDAGLRVIPALGISLKELSVVLKDDPKPFVKAGAIKVSLNWGQLLKLRLVPDILIKDAEVHVTQVDAEHYNFNPLLSQTTEPKENSEEKKPGNTQLGVSRLELQNSTLFYKPFEEDLQKHVIEKLAIHSVEMLEGLQRFKADVKAQLNGINVSGDFSGEIQSQKIDSETNLETQNDKQGKVLIKSNNFSASLPDTLAIKDEKLSLDVTFKQENQQTHIPDGILQLGPQKFSLSGLRGEKGDLDLKVGAAELNLDYLKKVIPALAGLPPIDGAAFSARYVTDGQPHSEPTISGQLNAQKISVPEYEITNASTQFFYHKPQLKVNDFKAQILEGALSGSAEVQMDPKLPDYSFDMTLKGISFDKIPRLSKLATGKGDITITATGKGLQENDWVKNLNADGTFNMHEVEIPTLNLFEKIFSSPAWNLVKNIPGAVNQKALAEVKSLGEKAREIVGDFQVVSGVLQVPKLNLNFSQAGASLGGGIGLDKSLDMNGTVTLQKELLSSIIQNPGIQQALLGSDGNLTLPIMIGGKTSGPAVSVDEKALAAKLQASLKATAQQKAGDIVQDVIKPPADGTGTKVPTKEELKDFLKKL